MKDNIHLIFGNDDFFVDLKTKKILEAYKDYSVEIIDGTMANIADLRRVIENAIESLRTMDFFSAQKCVWLRATNLLGPNSPALTEGAQATLDRWLGVIEKLPMDVHFVISASPVDKRTRLFKTLQTLAICEEMEEKRNEDYLHFLIKKFCEEQNVAIEPEAEELLSQKLNHQPRTIANELEKLACLKNFSGTITYDNVLKNTPTLINDEFFEPVEAFYEKNKERYIRSLRNHFILNKEMRSILTMMQNRNRLLIQLKVLDLQSISKNMLDVAYRNYEEFFGPVEEKNTFCIFSQNPWYLSRLKISFSLKQLITLQEEYTKIFDLILQTPNQACAYMENLVRFFCAI